MLNGSQNAHLAERKKINHQADNKDFLVKQIFSRSVIAR
jgi:hypothetical protein